MVKNIYEKYVNKKKLNIPTIFIGYDSREHSAYNVLRYTALKFASEPINIFPIDQDKLRRMGLYRRAWLLEAHKNHFKNKKIYNI